MKKKWIFREVDKLQSTDEFMERLNRWTKNPEGEPALEEWYMFGAPERIPFEIKKPEQWELDHAIYHPMYEEARRFEQSDQPERALEIYLEIHKRFTPRGTVYYDYPIWLLERYAYFDRAIEICEKAVHVISNNYFNAEIEPYHQDIVRLNKKIEHCDGYPSYEAFVFNKIIEIVKEHPDINITTLHSKLSKYEIYGERSYIDEAVEQNLITREKKGRSLIHNLP